MYCVDWLLFSIYYGEWVRPKRVFAVLYGQVVLYSCVYRFTYFPPRACSFLGVSDELRRCILQRWGRVLPMCQSLSPGLGTRKGSYVAGQIRVLFTHPLPSPPCLTVSWVVVGPIQSVRSSCHLPDVIVMRSIKYKCSAPNLILRPSTKQ